MFSLAWRYEKDLKKLASANGLRSPYTLYTGQRLTLDTSKARVIPRKSAATTTPKTTRTAATKPATSRPEATTLKTSIPKTTVPETRQKTASATSQRSVTLPSQWRWQRPVPGRITRHYDKSALFKGVDLQVRPGQPVHAAAPGLVVYAGNGLRGYGDLIIVKHSDVFLSAYGHNKKIKVKEGQVVKAGQTISEAGGDPANRRRLYFEIRKDGKPVNPLQYLPAG